MKEGWWAGREGNLFKKMRKEKIVKIIEKLFASLPDAKSELNFSNDYQLLVAVILSAHTTDKSVNTATKNLFKKVKTPGDILKLGEEKLREQIRSVGLYNNKAKNLIASAKILIKEHGGKLPNKRTQLEALPGVGRKTANIILNVIFNEPTLGVDTHIFRVANRTGIALGKNPRQIEDALLKVTPKKYIPNLHHVLLLHGRYICTAKKPKCSECVIKELCNYTS